MGEFIETRAGMGRLRTEASDAIQSLGIDLNQAKLEQQQLKDRPTWCVAERVAVVRGVAA